MNCHFITYRPYSDNNHKDDLDRYELFLSNNEGYIEGWSARKTFEPGDLAIFYFAQPLMTVDAIAYVDSDPYVEELDALADFSNPVFCDFRPALILEKEVSIKSIAASQPLIAKWWKTKPYQSIRRVDPEIALALIRGIVEYNPNELAYLEPVLKRLEGITGGGAKTRTTRKAIETPLPAAPLRAKPKAPARKKNWTARDFMRLDWREFEELVWLLFSHLHSEATVELGAGRVDHGVDVIITDKKTRAVQIVQCKRYARKNKVSSLDMQRFAGAMMKFKATKGYFVTSSSFNPYAVGFVEGMDDIELIEGKQLLKMINADDQIPAREEFKRG